MQHGDLLNNVWLGGEGTLGIRCKEADGGIKNEHRLRKTELREVCCAAFSDLLVAFSAALLSKEKPLHLTPWSSRVFARIREASQGASSAHCDIGGTRSSWELLSSGAETPAPLPISALGPIFRDPHHWPVYLTTCSVTALHGDAPLLFRKTNRRTDGRGLPRGQGQLSQLPSLVCILPPDICSVSFNGYGGGGGRGRTGGGKTP